VTGAAGSVPERQTGSVPERPSAFEVVGSTVLCEAGFLTVARVDVRAPDGAALVRHVVHHPGAVVVVPVDDDGKILMVRQWRVAAGRELLELPAGKRDVPGEPPEVTAARELEEEVGVRAGTVRPLCGFYNTPGFCDEYTHVFLATGLVATERGAVTAEEGAMTIERVAFDAFEDLVATGEVVDAKTMVGVFTARAFLRSA
jgi:ADP-ribose pyrophosphatase